MEYRIETIDFELRIIGKSKPVKAARAFKMIPLLWNSAKKDGFMQELIDISWENPKCSLEGLLGVCGKESAIKEDEFAYFMGVRYDNEPSNDPEVLTIPASTWVVFLNLVEAWKRLYTEWVPTSGYELANLPCIECYYGPKHELWVPIISP